MKILILEDRELTLSMLAEVLSKNGYSIIPCVDIYEANEAWNQGNIDMVITDLSMNPDGLTMAEKHETNGAILSGWIWLKNYVLKNNEDFKSRCIIFSDYIDYANQLIKENDIESGLFNDIKKIRKSSTNSIKDLIDATQLRRG